MRGTQPVQSFIHYTQRNFRPIAVATQVPEIKMPQFIGHDLLSGIGGGGVRKMTVPAENALLEAPGSARIILQQFQIVIRFQDKHIRAADTLNDEFRCVTEIREETDSSCRRVKQKADGIIRVVRHTEGVDAHIVDIEAGARAEDIATDRRIDCEFDRFFSQAIAINRHVQLCGEHGQSLNVIMVLVRNENAREIFWRAADRQQAISDLPRAQAGVNEQPRFICFEISTIAAGAAAKNRELH